MSEPTAQPDETGFWRLAAAEPERIAVIDARGAAPTAGALLEVAHVLADSVPRAVISEAVPRDANFCELGGDSLAGIQALARQVRALRPAATASPAP